MAARLGGGILLALVTALCTACGNTSRLDRYGVSLHVPARWHARLSFSDSLNGFVLQAATVPIVDPSSDLPTATERRLGADGVLVVLFEYGPNPDGRYVGVTDFPARRQPLALPPLSRVSFEGQTAPGQSMEALKAAGRYMQLFVFYGRRRPSPPQLAAARGFLSGIRISPRRS